VVTVYPLCLAEREEQATFEASGDTEVDLFGGSPQPQVGFADETFLTGVVALGPLAVDDETEPLLEGELLVARIGQLLLMGREHTEKTHLAQLLGEVPHPRCTS
jgi:hypothetical protein